MQRRLIGAAAAATLALATIAGSALAGQPANPGCFGQDRAAYIHDVAQNDPTSPGASEVGAILGGRGAANGEINRAYKEGCGGAPTP